MRMRKECEVGGTGPGSMLFADKYNMGVCLSQLQDKHLVDTEVSLTPGNPLQQVVHVVF